MSFFARISLPVWAVFCLFSGAAWADVAVPLTPGETAAAEQRAADEAPPPRKVSELQTTSAMADESRIVAYCLERMHYLRTPVKRLNPNTVLDIYLEDLDPVRLFFLQSDVDEIKARFAPTLDVFLQQGNLLPAFAIFQTYRERVRERCEWVAERLKEPFDFGADETFRPDRKDSPWLADAAQADAVWQQRLKFELLNESLAPRKKKAAEKNGSAAAEAKKDAPSEPVPEPAPNAEDAAADKAEKTFEERLALGVENLEKRYARFLKATDEIESVEVQEIYLNSVASVYDPHSGFLSPYYLEEFDISMRNALVGVGAVLSEKDGYCTVRELIAGGPAERSGQLHVGDKIVGVAQGDNGEMNDVIGMKLRKVVRQIRGKKGTIVRLLIQPADGDPSDRTTLRIERDEIKLTDKLARAELLDVPAADGRVVKVGVVELPSFYGAQENERAGTAEDVKALVSMLKEAGMQALVLDVRKNGGGYLNEAIDLAGLFMAGGPVLQVRDMSGKVQELRDRMKNALAWDGPLVLLVSRLSASATEIVAGALQNHNRAVIVGDPATHGKGTVQAVYPFEHFSPRQKGAAKITINKWYLPDGNSIQVKGVSSDIVLPSSLDALPIGEGDLDRALEWDSIPSLPLAPRAADGFDKGKVSDALVQRLGALSAGRMEALPEFALLKEEVAWNRERAQKKEFSLSRAVREKERARDNETRDQFDAQSENFAGELNYPSREFKLKIATDTPTFNVEEDLELTPEERELADLDKKPAFDVRLREGARIAADWYALANPVAVADSAPKGAPENGGEPPANLR